MTDIHDPETQLRIRCEKLQQRAKRYEDDRNRLRAAIEEAPHTLDCTAQYQHVNPMAVPEFCDCWKRKALSGKG